jgi:hypothetical protein
LKIQYSKHALAKIEERKIDKTLIERVLINAELTFYDIVNRTFVGISKVKIQEFETNLVVVYTKSEENFKIVTVYPCKNIEKEIKAKEKNRWIRI